MVTEKIQGWARHTVTIVLRRESVRTVCTRCGQSLPSYLLPGQVVLGKQDRLYLGDHPAAEDCRAV